MSFVHFAKSEKGKDLLMVGNYKYAFQKILSGGIKRWTCASRSKIIKCSAIAKTQGISETVVDVSGNHSHDPTCEADLNRYVIYYFCITKIGILLILFFCWIDKI